MNVKSIPMPSAAQLANANKPVNVFATAAKAPAKVEKPAFTLVKTKAAPLPDYPLEKRLAERKEMIKTLTAPKPAAKVAVKVATPKVAAKKVAAKPAAKKVAPAKPVAVKAEPIKAVKAAPAKKAAPTKAPAKKSSSKK